MENIQHSAEGTTWSKKNHKYIRKEGNRYIYETDTSKKKTAREILSDKGITKATKSGKGQRVYDYENLNERGQIRNEGAYTSRGDSIRAVQNVKSKRSARDSLDNYINNRNVENNKHYTNYENHLEAGREKAMVAAKKEQAYQSFIDSHTTHHSSDLAKQRSRILRSAKQDADNKRLADSQYRANQLKEANLARARSSARPVRDVLSDRRQNRVSYITDNNGSRRRVTQYKYRPGQSQLVSSGRSVRDVLSDRGTRRVSYQNTPEGRQRIVSNNDFKRKATDVTKNFGSKDTRSAFKKKISEFGKRIGIGRDAIYNYTQGVLKDSKERVKAQKQAEKEQRRLQREADRQIPLNMRLKRNAKKGKKALSKYFPFLN